MSRALIDGLNKLLAAQGSLASSQLSTAQRLALNEFAQQTGIVAQRPQGRGSLYVVINQAQLVQYLRVLQPIQSEQIHTLPQRAANLALYRNSKSQAHQHDWYYVLIKAITGQDVVWQHQQKTYVIPKKKSLFIKFYINIGALFAAKVQSLQQQWQQLTEQKSYTLSNALQQRFDAASTQAQQKVTAEQSKKALFEQQKTVANAFTTLQADVLLIDNVNNINQLSEKLNALSYDWQYCTQHTEADTQLVQQVQKSQQTLQKYSDLFQQTAPHIEAMLQHHQQLVDSPINQTAYDALQTLLQNTELLNTKLTLPALFSSIIDSFNTAQKALAAYQNAQEKNEEVTVNTPISTPNKKTASHPELEKLLLQIAECFNQGQSKEADKILRQAQKYAKANHLFDPRLGDWLQELQKMKDWAGFAILPKKEELVAQMKTLAEQAESQTDPLTQLDKIKLLQAEGQA